MPIPPSSMSPSFVLADFTRSQTAARRGIDNTPDAKAVAALRLLATNVLEPVRAQFGRVLISSGYRSPELNKAIRGSRTSQHMLGQAVDFECPEWSNVEVARWIAGRGKFDQVILEFYSPTDPTAGWVHVSYVGARANRREALTAVRAPSGRTQYIPGLP